MERTFAFLGPRGTNTEEAARLIFREEDDVFRPYRTIPDCLEAAADGKVNYAVVPWENSLEGSVNLTLDWIIHKINLPILSELIIPISHQLSCAKREHPLALSDVTKVLSHPQAIAQCHNYLRDYLPHAEIEYVSSTAEAARLVSEHPEEPWVAISAMQAVHSYPVMLLAENIEDTENNFTRLSYWERSPWYCRIRRSTRRRFSLRCLPISPVRCTRCSPRLHGGVSTCRALNPGQRKPVLATTIL